MAWLCAKGWTQSTNSKSEIPKSNNTKKKISGKCFNIGQKNVAEKSEGILGYSTHSQSEWEY